MKKAPELSRGIFLSIILVTSHVSESMYFLDTHKQVW